MRPRLNKTKQNKKDIHSKIIYRFSGIPILKNSSVNVLNILFHLFYRLMGFILVALYMHLTYLDHFLPPCYPPLSLTCERGSVLYFVHIPHYRALCPSPFLSTPCLIIVSPLLSGHLFQNPHIKENM